MVNLSYQGCETVADKNAIYKEFEEWIEMDDLDHDIYSLAYIGEDSEYDI